MHTKNTQTDTQKNAPAVNALASNALWQGRFEKKLSDQALAFETSIHVDSLMVFDDINGSIAHVKMLGAQNIIPHQEAKAIADELHKIEDDIRSGALTIDTGFEDIHSFIEHVLTERLGDTGKKVHTGRSRNDQIALDERLYLRRTISALQKRILTLINALCTIAEDHTESLISGYTHLQRAQPVSLAQHLCAWAWMLKRDYGRFSDALGRANLSPLGSAALAGSGLPLDRSYTAQELGFDGIVPNSMDAVADRDYCIETVSAAALCMTHLSRFCEEIILWASSEFGFIDLDEQWSTGSSIMPQKKNPDFAELIRGRTGLVYGDLTALFTMMKGLPLAYNRDMQEDKISLFRACGTLDSCLEVFTEMIKTAKWNTERMAASCRGGFANATDLADYLVKKGMPFRTAHGCAAAAVRLCIERGIQLEDLPLEEYKAISPLIEKDVFERLEPSACLKAKNTAGGAAPEQVVRQLESLRRFYTQAVQAKKE
ncbi:argininosuccinate lyase [Treponema sp. OMZ 840]|uniref:argininosuccinate lyase n=1 Tax=Treponema sp. OMZ 840 TaxID=244313 RepID=UPI003D8CD2AD